MSLHNNQLNKSSFTMVVPDAAITETFFLNISSALIPGFRVPVTNTPLGNKGIARANIPGTTMEFDPLIVRVLLDDELKAWEEIYTWMLGYNNYFSHESNGFEEGVMPEFITLNVMSNDKSKIVLSIHFIGAWPSDVGDVEFDFTEDGDPAMYCNVTFNFRYFAVERNGVIIEHRKSISDQVPKSRESNIAL